MINLYIIISSFLDYRHYANNKFKLDSTNNKLRIINAVFSIIINVLLVIRAKLKLKFQNVKYILGIRLKCIFK